MDTNLAKPTPIDEHKNLHQKKTHHHGHHLNQATNATLAHATATLDRIPTETWGPFTIGIVVLLVIMTCFILNCNRIRRKVDEHRMMMRHGTKSSSSYEKRHKDLQEADLEWNIHPPMVFTQQQPLLSTPESTYNNKRSSSSDWSSSSTISSIVAQKHHYQDKEFIKNQPPGVQLRLTLENASSIAAT